MKYHAALGQLWRIEEFPPIESAAPRLPAETRSLVIIEAPHIPLKLTMTGDEAMASAAALRVIAQEIEKAAQRVMERRPALRCSFRGKDAQGLEAQCELNADHESNHARKIMGSWFALT